MGAWFRWLRELWLGLKTLGQTTERATALPATGNLFTVAGGRIMVKQLIGELTAACDANATATRIVATPTAGTARDMCAALDIASYAIGDLLGITGINTDAMIPPATGGAVEGQTMGVIVKPGVINMIVAAPGQVTGSVRWTLKWVPIDTAASVVAA